MMNLINHHLLLQSDQHQLRYVHARLVLTVVILTVCHFRPHQVDKLILLNRLPVVMSSLSWKIRHAPKSAGDHGFGSHFVQTLAFNRYNTLPVALKSYTRVWLFGDF